MSTLCTHDAPRPERWPLPAPTLVPDPHRELVMVRVDHYSRLPRDLFNISKNEKTGRAGRPRRRVLICDIRIFPYAADIMGVFRLSGGLARPPRPPSLHEPAVADDQRLAGQGVAFEPGEENRRLGDVSDGRELAVDRLLQHHVLDDLGFGNAQLLRLLRDLLVDERRAHEAGTDDIGAYAVRGPLFRDHLGEPDQAVFGGDVGRLQHRRLL